MGLESIPHGGVDPREHTGQIVGVDEQEEEVGYEEIYMRI